MSWLLVTVGGALGALLRYAVIQSSPWNGTQLPVATLLVNILGSFAAGLAYVLITERASPELLRAFWLTGVLGGFTTYSAFAVETVVLQQGGRPVLGTIYVVVTVCGCLLAARVGYLLAQPP